MELIVGGVVFFAAGYAFWVNRSRMEAFGRGIHSDGYARLVSYGLAIGPMILGTGMAMVGLWDVLFG